MESKDLLDLDEPSEISKAVDGQKRLDNDKRIYNLGILSIFLYIPVGTFMAIFSLIRANEELDEYRISPELYSYQSYIYVSKGRMFAIVGLILQIISIPIYITLSIMFG